MTAPESQMGGPFGLGLPILQPITAQVQLPASYALAEAWAAYQAATRVEIAFTSAATTRAADRAYLVMVKAAHRVDHRSLGYPAGITAWVEKKIKEMNCGL